MKNNSMFGSPIFIGVIESRMDPLKLNRVQVRVFGVHSEALEDIPVEKLPWAVCASNFAAVSGIGHSGSQYLEGSVVFVFFQDGESKQLPVIIGAMHGVPVDISPFKGEEQVIDDELVLNAVEYKQDINPTDIIEEVGEPLDSSGTKGTPLTPETKVEKEKEVSSKNSSDSRQALKDALGKRESNNNYGAVNQFGYTGKYQMGAAYLADRGYMKPGVKQSKANMDNPDNWTGKDGVKSAADFKNRPDVQEKAMDAGLDANERSLKKMGVIDSNSTEQEKAGMLATSHLLGTGGARDMKNGKVGKDGNGVTGNSYYNLGYKAVAGKDPKVSPDKTEKDNPSREPSTNPNVGKTIAKKPVARVDDVGINDTDVTAGGSEPIATSDLGFMDPNEIYPEYFDEQDTNRLARNQNIGLTIVPIKEELEDKNVLKANGKGKWDQSPTPYNAKYPFNSVWESESGHVIEIDDTENNERIHMYHKTGTFQEIDRNGTLVRRIIGDAYEIWDRDGFIHIKGECNITVEGNANILVANDCELEVDGFLNANVGKDSNWSIAGNSNYTVGGDVNWNVKGKTNYTVGGDVNHSIAGDVNNVVNGNIYNNVGKGLHNVVKGTLNNDVAKDLNNVIKGSINNTISTDLNNSITGNINTSVGGSDKTLVSGDYHMITGGAEHHTNGGVHATTASPILVSIIPVIGASAAVPPAVTLAQNAEVASDITALKLPPPPNTATGAPVFGKLSLEPRGFEELSDFETDDLTNEEAAGIETKLRDAGYTDPNPIPADIDNTKAVVADANVKKEKPVMCGSFVSGKINLNQFISPNFRLKDLTSGSIPLQQGGLKDVELACNLKALAENVLEPIKAKYPNMIITSGLRPYSTNKKSQHPLGQAADIQFPGSSSEQYAAIAKDISGTVPFGQLILEYNTNRRMQGSPVTWIHVSFSSGGNKGESFTMNNHSVVKGSSGKFEVIK
jgi:hypothetical protein